LLQHIAHEQVLLEAVAAALFVDDLALQGRGIQVHRLAGERT
jgi:hypothetical protein